MVSAEVYERVHVNGIPEPGSDASSTWFSNAPVSVFTGSLTVVLAHFASLEP